MALFLALCSSAVSPMCVHGKAHGTSESILSNALFIPLITARNLKDNDMVFLNISYHYKCFSLKFGPPSKIFEPEKNVIKKLGKH
jgi:hypothetical protein